MLDVRRDQQGSLPLLWTDMLKMEKGATEHPDYSYSDDSSMLDMGKFSQLGCK